MSMYLNPNIEAMSAYVPGEQRDVRRKSGSLLVLLKADGGRSCVCVQAFLGGEQMYVVSHAAQRIAGEVGKLRLFNKIIHRQRA